MNYYLFTTDLRRAGAQRAVSILAEYWSHEVKVTVILMVGDVEFELPKSVRIISLNCATDSLHFYSGLLVYQCLHKLREILAENKGPFAFFSFLESPNFISILLKKKFSHGIFIGGMQVNIYMYNRIFHLLYRNYRQLDALVSCSHANRRLFIDKFGMSEAKSFFIPNPVNFDDVKRQLAEEIPIKLANLIGKGPLIIAAGRLVKVKNYALLLRAFAKIPASEQVAQLIILGDGPERPHLLKLAKQLGISDRLVMPGNVANPFIWMANGDLFVHTSNYEGWGNVIAEAMATGLPVVACDAPFGPAEILHNGAFGILVPINNVEALTAAMIKLLRGGKIEYPFLREWSADIIASRYRKIAQDIFEERKIVEGSC